MTDLVFTLGGVRVPIHAALDFRQSYESIGGYSTRRMTDGTLVKQGQWLKLKTTIQANGWIPAGLDGLDYSQSLVMQCVSPKSIVSASNVMTLPAARRADSGYDPAGWALVAGEWVSTPVNLVVNTATLTIVSGATQYRVMFYPEISVLADPPRQAGDMSGAQYSWQLTAEEV